MSVAFVPLLLEGVGDELMVSEDEEVAHFQHVMEMLHSLIDCQQLSIVGAVFLPGRIELLGEEGKGLQALLTRCCSAASM
jgi:hypothetical protein